MAVPQNEVANAQEASTSDLNVKQKVEAEQGRNQNDPGGPKMSTKGASAISDPPFSGLDLPVGGWGDISQY